MASHRVCQRQLGHAKFWNAASGQQHLELSGSEQTSLRSSLAVLARTAGQEDQAALLPGREAHQPRPAQLSCTPQVSIRNGRPADVNSLRCPMSTRKRGGGGGAVPSPPGAFSLLSPLDRSLPLSLYIPLPPPKKNTKKISVSSPMSTRELRHFLQAPGVQQVSSIPSPVLSWV